MTYQALRKLIKSGTASVAPAVPVPPILHTVDVRYLERFSASTALRVKIVDAKCILCRQRHIK